MTSEFEAPKLRVLVIGGTGFIGRVLVRALRDEAVLAKHGLPHCELWLLNRGNTYWRPEDPELWEEQQRFERTAFVHLPCTRKDPKQFAQVLRETLPEGGGDGGGSKHWDAVIDFCAYKPEHIEPILQELAGQIRLYLFISTDSVYEVCPLPAELPTGRLEQQDARPADEGLRRRLRSSDSYGDDKLRCEELLREHSRLTGLAFVALRLCDVIGPFDDTDRFWASQMLVQACADRGWELPVSRSDRERQMSFTFSQDVVEAILATLAAGPAVAGHSFNIACPQRCTNAQLFQMIADCLRVPLRLVLPVARRRRRRRADSDQDSNRSSSSTSASSSEEGAEEEDNNSSDSESTESDDSSSTEEDEEDRASRTAALWEDAELPLASPKSYFPSVSFGCVDGSKAENLLLSFRPTALQEAVHSTVEFFRTAWQLYPAQCLDAIRNLPPRSPVRAWLTQQQRQRRVQPSNQQQPHQ